MAKDPAMLWYWNDWIGGTMAFSRHLKGCYIDLLATQFNSGHLSLDEIKTVLGSDFSAWGTIQKKFEKDEKGLFYNVRLEEEQRKRKAFTESRRSNRKTHEEHTTSHMDSHMEDINKDVNEKEFENIWNRYPDKSGKKDAQRHFFSSVKNQTDIANITLALDNYLKSERVKKGFIQNGSTWFNNWRDWINPSEITMQKGKINGAGRGNNEERGAGGTTTEEHLRKSTKLAESFIKFREEQSKS